MDRNYENQELTKVGITVAPRRGAWIEMVDITANIAQAIGRTPQGCVDRNRRCRVYCY